MAMQAQQLSLDGFLCHGNSSNSKRPRHDSNEVVIVDSDPDLGCSNSIDHGDKNTGHVHYENDTNHYRDKDISASFTSNILCNDDKYESEDLFDFTKDTFGEQLLSESPLPAEPESSDEEQDCRDGSEDELYVLHQTNTDSESTTSN